MKRIAESTASAEQFLSEAEVEQRELFRDYLNQHGDDGETLLTATLRVILEQGGKERRTRVEVTDDFERTLFKDCSKYIHASPWLINELCRLHDPYMRRMFIAYCLHFLSGMFQMALSLHPETRYLTEQPEDDTAPGDLANS